MNKVNTLRKFFNVSTAAFEFARVVSDNFAQKQSAITIMNALHISAKHELDKDNPDLQVIDSLLRRMEELAEENGKNK